MSGTCTHMHAQALDTRPCFTDFSLSSLFLFSDSVSESLAPLSRSSLSLSRPLYFLSPHSNPSLDLLPFCSNSSSGD